MKQIPFYENRDDNISCTLACVRSALEYFSGREWSWEEVEKISGFEGRPVWTAKMWTYLANHGYDIRMIESFDYHRFEKEGEKYLHEYLQPEELEWQLRNSDILKLPEVLPDFLETMEPESRSPQLEDIDDMLQAGYLVKVQLNSRALNKKDGYVSHQILVHDKVDGDYIAHDPGLPGIPNREIDPKLLLEAMGGKNNRVEVTGIRKARNGESGN